MQVYGLLVKTLVLDSQVDDFRPVLQIDPIRSLTYSYSINKAMFDATSVLWPCSLS